MFFVDKEWLLASITANTATDAIVPATGKTSQIVTMAFSNTGAASGTLTVTKTDASNTVLSTLVPGVSLAPYTVLELKSRNVIDPHKIRVTFTQTTLSMDANGQEG